MSQSKWILYPMMRRAKCCLIPVAKAVFSFVEVCKKKNIFFIFKPRYHSFASIAKVKSNYGFEGAPPLVYEGRIRRFYGYCSNASRISGKTGFYQELDLRSN